MAPRRRRTYRRKTTKRYAKKRTSPRRTVRASRSAIRAPSSGNRGGMVITHREFIKDIHPTTAFTKYDFDLNPGISGTFPWLSQMCDAYEEYKVKAIVFEFRSLCADSTVNAAGNLSMGSAIMATNYNPNKAPFVDKRTMENYEGCVARKPNQSFIHVIDIKKSTTPISGLKWLRTGATQANEDIRLYDIGKFSFATVGMPVADAVNPGVIGELWVAYSIEFFKPKYQGSIGSALQQDHYVHTTAMASTFPTTGPFGQFPVEPLGSIRRPNALSMANTWLTKNTSAVAGYDTLNFDSSHQGKYFMITLAASGGSAAACAAYAITVGSYVNLTAINWFNNQTVSFIRNDAGQTLSTIFIQTIVRVENDDFGPWTMRFNQSLATMPANPTVDVWITQLNGTPEAVSF